MINWFKLWLIAAGLGGTVAVSVTMAVITSIPGEQILLAGVMGMNFQVGLFENAGLFWVVVASMIVFALTTLVIARRRGWL